MNSPFKPFANPILLVSDGPDLVTGLGRVARDLASLASKLPQFRVATLGRAATGRAGYPWMQYCYPESGQWGEGVLESVCADWFGSDFGIVLTLDDLSRRLWFACPQAYPPGMAKFLGTGRNYAKWAYVPVDGFGPVPMRLPVGMEAALLGYDRVCAASEWGREVMRNSGRRDADWVPHGVWMDRFVWTNVQPDANSDGPSLSCRRLTSWNEHDIWLGCVMTNQARKDWPVAFHCAALLRRTYGNRFRAWFHTDRMEHYWNLHALAADYGLTDGTVEITMDLSDEQLALRYSACDATILPTGAEGFGFPIAESMACGTPCVTTGYAAGQELVPPEMCVEPITWRVDTQHNVARAVTSGHGFAAKAGEWIERKRADWEGVSEECRARVEHLGWDKLEHVWRRWFLDGLR